MPIQAKRRPLIRKGNGYVYNPATFNKEHKISHFYVVSSAEELLQRVQPFELMGRRFITFDTETQPVLGSSQEASSSVVRRWVGSGKSAHPQDYPFCISICDGKNSFTLFDSYRNNFAEMRKLAPLLEDPAVEKIAHNAKFDMHMLANAGMKIVGRLHDTVVLAKLVDENRRSFQLRDLAAGIPGGITKFEYMVDAYKQANKVAVYSQIPKELLSEYANADVHNCYLEFITDYPKLFDMNLDKLYDNECELMIALYAMERYGMRIDESYREPLIDELQTACDNAEQEIYNEAGRMFNINSTKQLYEVLMQLGVSPTLVAKTDKGNPKLDKDALANLAEKHNVSIVQKILTYRKYSKLLGTYAVGIYEQRDASGRVHGSINQTEATTGRMSITKPALQTLGKKDTHIRTAFIPSEDHILYFQDLDQIEFRGFAHYAKATSILQAIAAGYDVHTATAATVFNKDVAELAKRVHEGDKEATALRARAKTVNFALLYGVGQNHLAEILGCTVTEATEIKANYFAGLPEARTFIGTVQEVTKMRGYIRNYYGRRRRLDADDCYKAPNALIQGWAADYIKHKMVLMFKFLRYNKCATKMINVIHDEVVFDMPKSEMHIMPELRWLMSEFEAFRCPMTAGAEVAEHDWGHKVEKDVGFKEPDSFEFMNYNVYDGSVFDIH